MSGHTSSTRDDSATLCVSASAVCTEIPKAKDLKYIIGICIRKTQCNGMLAIPYIPGYKPGTVSSGFLGR